MHRYLGALLLLCGLLSCSVADPGTVDVPEPGERIATSMSKLVTDCDYMNPAMHPLPAVPIDPARELIITALPVVNDPCRTTWTAGGCPPGTLGAWTAGSLFNEMSGQPIALPAPPAPLPGPLRVSALMGEWIHAWEVPQVVNSFVVPARVGVRAQIIDPWIAATVALGGPPALCFPGAAVTGAGSCPLDPRAAPMRLLAIVNRVDLGGNTTFIPVTPGEGRFVFGMLDQFGNPLQFTVIFEYKLPTSASAIGWEASWHLLSGLAMGTPPYLAQLQTITDGFSKAGVQPGNPNLGNSIGSVRSNEIALAAPWELRTFALLDQGAGFNSFLLRQVPNEQTPADTLNLSLDLDAWQVANEPAILAVSHTVPQGFPSGLYALGGGATAPFTWNNGGTAGPLNPMARHLFGFATCNGCHSVETGGTPFVHIGPRPAAGVAPLSAFLSSTTAPGAGGFPAGSLNFPDPVSGAPLGYNEPWRRVCEAARLLAGDPQPFTKPNGAH